MGGVGMGGHGHGRRFLSSEALACCLPQHRLFSEGAQVLCVGGLTSDVGLFGNLESVVSTFIQVARAARLFFWHRTCLGLAVLSPVPVEKAGLDWTGTVP